MSIVVAETGKRRAKLSEESTSEREYTVYHASSETDAASAVEAHLIANNMTVRGSLLLREIDAEDTAAFTEDGLRVYVCKAHWRAWREQYRDVGESAEAHEEEWDIGSETTTIYVPLSVEVKRPTGLPAPIATPSLKLIGDRLDGNPPTGVEWPSPVTTFSIPQVVPTEDMTFAVIEFLEGMVGKLNAAAFRGRPAECVQYLGATIRQRGRADVVLMHRFKSYPQKTIEVDGFADFDSAGFDFVWPTVATHQESNQAIARPGFLGVAKIGVTSNFDSLGV